MAKSCPSSPFYWNDYYRDTRVLTLPTRAIWMDMLCRAHESHTRGQIRLSVGAWARWCACKVEDITLAEIELRHHPDVGLIMKETVDPSDPYNYESNVFLTVTNRRMVREALFKENNAERQDRFRKKRTDNEEVTLDVTPLSRTSNIVPSSSLSSSSSDNQKKRRSAPTDDEWLASLSADPTYEGLDIQKLRGKCENWCTVNRKIFSRRRFINWLNGEDTRMRGGGSVTSILPKSFKKYENARSEHEPMPTDFREIIAQAGKAKGMPA